MKLLLACLPFISIAPLLCIGCQSETLAPTALPVSTMLPTLDVPRAQFSIAGGIAVPDNGALRIRPTSPETNYAQIHSEGDRLPVLNEIIGLTPSYFPPGARVLPTNPGSNISQGTEVINLNRAFEDAKFWKTRSRQDTKLAFHALARVIAFRNEPKGAPEAVQFLVEGKRVTKIGSFSVKTPLQPKDILGIATEVHSRAQQSQKAK